MITTTTNGIELSYEIQGEGDPLVLIMGLGGQLTDWPLGFVNALAAHFTVIRFDNRDSGLSSYSNEPVPSRRTLIKSSLRPDSVTAPYSLADMADDTAALLSDLDIERANIVGMSMGGMIAQRLALQHPGVVRSLCSIMSNTGNRRHGRPTPAVLRALAQRDDPGREHAIDVTMDLFSMIGGPDWDPDEQRSRSTASIERAYNPSGVLRQSLAIATTPDRTRALRKVSVPTLVVHGLDDPLVQYSGGMMTARAIAASQLLLFPGMGHDIPATRHEEITPGNRRQQHTLRFGERPGRSRVTLCVETFRA